MADKLSETIEALDLTTKPSDDCEEDLVDPWNVTSGSDKGIDYDKLISRPIHYYITTVMIFILLLYREIWQL